MSGEAQAAEVVRFVAGCGLQAIRVQWRSGIVTLTGEVAGASLVLAVCPDCERGGSFLEGLTVSFTADETAAAGEAGA